MNSATYVDPHDWVPGRVRCKSHGKVVLTEDEAKRKAQKIVERHPIKGDEYMEAYAGDCGYWHVGHNYRRNHATRLHRSV